MAIRVFMLGWEFPPFISGGLGTACYGLTKALDQLGTKIIFVLPHDVPSDIGSHVEIRTPRHLTGMLKERQEFQRDALRNVTFRTVRSWLRPYDRPESYHGRRLDVLCRQLNLSSETISCLLSDVGPGAHYSGDMYREVQRYAAAAAQMALLEEFDVIHAHDWMTFPAGIAVAAITGKPLVVQVHSTEFDRSGEHVNQMIYDIERRGMHAADRIIAVSGFTKSIITSRYGVPADKVEVVYNGVDRNGNRAFNYETSAIKKDEKVVLFLGRITMQKGPEYFLGAARKVLEVMDNVKFVMAGSGDMMNRTIELAAQLGIGHKVLFTGFLRGEEVDRVYRMADLYVMPSVSEPFGIAPLEALNNDIPVIISRQSGVSEVLKHVLKVDFWDVNEMANKIVAVLKYQPLQTSLRQHGNYEVRRLRWEESARKCLSIYEQAIMSS
jgi:glycosyltransferase involved in cell wall biosynthesis